MLHFDTVFIFAGLNSNYQLIFPLILTGYLI